MKSNIQFKWNGSLASEKIRKAAKIVIGNATEYILQESNKIVPLDESTLQRSGNTDVKVDANGVSGSVYYDTPYAARLHEHPEYKFQNGREGKYLEKTINNEHPKVLKYLADECKKVIK